VRSVTATAYARAGFLGNPSDVFGGRVIAFTFRDFAARVTIEPAGKLELDALDAPSFHDAVAPGVAARQHGGRALVAAAAKRLADRFPHLLDLASDDLRLRFRLTFTTDIPRQAGLAGSSAIVVAALRALSAWFEVALDAAPLAELALAAEAEELGITAGPMDRVVQAHEGLLYMDCGAPGWRYSSLDPALLPPLFIAWDCHPGEDSGAVHERVRRRWAERDPAVLAAVEELASLADEGREALRRHDLHDLRRLVERNFALRASAWGLDPRDEALAAVGGRLGATLKLCGSGGAVLGVMRDDAEYAPLEAAYRERGYGIIRPRLSTGPARPV
jgi:glucuronokinase